jgi:hypothetical protein
VPNYTFKDTNTGKIWIEEFKISEKEQYLKENPHIQQIITSGMPTVREKLQTDSGWRDMLGRIKKANRGSTIDTGNVGEI